MTNDDKSATAAAGPALSEGLGPTPPLAPAGFRTRYRSEPGMIGHYPWTYADAGRRKGNRPECEYEDLFTTDQMRAAVAAERERCAKLCEDIGDAYQTSEGHKWPELKTDAQTGAHDCAAAIRA